ncbi:MAG: tyrosine-type recombinase/integrase [Phycisphaerales bacterium]
MTTATTKPNRRRVRLSDPIEAPMPAKIVVKPSTGKVHRVERRQKFTAANVKSFRPDGEPQTTYRSHPADKGFVVIASGTCNTYGVEKRIGSSGSVKFRKIGRVEAMALDEARKIARDWLNKMASGIDPYAERDERVAKHDAQRREDAKKAVTVRALWDRYKSERTMRPTTIRNAEWMLGVAERKNKRTRFAATRPLEDWLDTPVGTITREMVASKYRRIIRDANAMEKKRCEADPDRPHREDAGSRKAGGAFQLLRAMMRFAKSRGIVTENPVDVLSEEQRGWATSGTNERVIERHEWPALFNAFDAMRASGHSAQSIGADWLQFVALSGLRRRESASIEWGWINTKTRTLTIPGHVTKNKKPHTVPLTVEHEAIIERRRRDNPPGSRWVFPSPKFVRKPGPISCAGSATRGPWGAVVEHGGPKAHTHVLRHSFSTVANEIGIPKYTIDSLTAHTTPKGDVTGRYVKISGDHRRESMEKIVKFIIELATPPNRDLRIAHVA